MDADRVGKAIAHLRKRAGLTQKELAERIGISDKAVSKWERGISFPDIAYLSRLANLLDTDSDSLLSGDMIRRERAWQGLLVLPENSCGIGADAIVYDKPLVYYLLSYYLLAGIDRILVSCSEKDETFLRGTLGKGGKLGIELEYCGTAFEEAMIADDGFAGCDNVMVVFGRRLIYGAGLTRFFQRAMSNRECASLLVNPSQSKNYRELPILFAPRPRLVDACRDAGFAFMESEGPNESSLYAEKLDRGFVDFSLESVDEVAEATAFVRTVQKASGMHLYCLEEIAWRRGMIDAEALKVLGKEKADTPYGQYILSLSE